MDRCDAPGDVLLASSPEVRGRTDVEPGTGEWERLEAEHFTRPRACLHASPLPRTYGWGLHYDVEGRITLHAVGSPGCARLSSDASVTQLRAMRSRRAAP